MREIYHKYYHIDVKMFISVKSSCFQIIRTTKIRIYMCFSLKKKKIHCIGSYLKYTVNTKYLMIYNLRMNNNQTCFPILGNTKIYYDKKKISIKHYTLYQKKKNYIPSYFILLFHKRNRFPYLYLIILKIIIYLKNYFFTCRENME